MILDEALAKPAWNPEEHRIESISHLIETYNEMTSLTREWVFRGESNPNRSLETTLRRCFNNLDINENYFGKIEGWLLREFKRFYHLYGSSPVPHLDDTLAYLALMRHYGSPARLLDFTFSIFIACYFAIEKGRIGSSANGEMKSEDSPRREDNSIVWAVDKTWLTKHNIGYIKTLTDGENLLARLGERQGAAFEEVYIKSRPEKALIGPVNPSFMNDRLAVQKGLFLCSTSLSLPFEQVLWSMPDSKEHVRKLQIDSSARRELLLVFERMNISRAGLFPGLQGFGESLYGKVLLFEQLEKMREMGGRF